MPVNGGSKQVHVYILQLLASKFCQTLRLSQERTTQIHKEIFKVTFSPSFCPLKAGSSIDSVISVIAKTVFVLMLPLQNGFWNSLEFLGIPRNEGVNFHCKFGVGIYQEFLGIPSHNNSGSKNLEIPRNPQKFPGIPRNFKFVANRNWPQSTMQ